MASRCTDTKLFDYCVSPRVIWQNGERRVVPCGKCDGCLLHKANSWSMRLRNELDYMPYAIWFTLTYNDKYLPNLRFYDDGLLQSDHDGNIRFDGIKDVPRQDGIIFENDLLGKYQLPKFRPQNASRPYIHLGYSSKRDFQLFLKLLRKHVTSRFGVETSIRYYAVSEYGPTTFRPHIHGLIFSDTYEVANFCKESALFESWQMCNKTLFDQHTRFADSGVSGYVTNYITGFSDLPAFFKDKQIRPFRLASKGKAIGSDSFNEKVFFEQVVSGDMYYIKRVDRLGIDAVCQYPSNFTNSVFPKCYEFSKLSFGRLLEVYGFLFTNVTERGCLYRSVYRRLLAFKNPSNIQAARKCYQICMNYGYSVFHYCFLLDLFYYRRSMQSLFHMYNYQSKHMRDLSSMVLYENFIELCKEFLTEPSESLALSLSYFMEGFGFSLSDITYDFLDSLSDYTESGKQLYIKELEEVRNESVKQPKNNELFGLAPHIV